MKKSFEMQCRKTAGEKQSREIFVAAVRSFSEICSEFPGVTCCMTWYRQPANIESIFRHAIATSFPFFSLPLLSTAHFCRLYERDDAESSSGMEPSTTLNAETRKDVGEKYDPSQTLINDCASFA